MYAYPDSKCVFGYMTLCSECHTEYYTRKDSRCMRHLDLDNPLISPPNMGVKQPCESCGRNYVLKGK